LGLFAARDLEKNQMIIEYIGDQIRNEVANRRERLYQSQNRGIYMFRLNDDWVVDATMSGGLARYINHCCDPNCIAETVACEKDEKIIIIANKRILKGEEVIFNFFHSNFVFIYLTLSFSINF
jgi:SET domain-containing protein